MHFSAAECIGVKTSMGQTYLAAGSTAIKAINIHTKYCSVTGLCMACV